MLVFVSAFLRPAAYDYGWSNQAYLGECPLSPLPAPSHEKNATPNSESLLSLGQEHSVEHTMRML